MVISMQWRLLSFLLLSLLFLSSFSSANMVKNSKDKNPLWSIQLSANSIAVNENLIAVTSDKLYVLDESGEVLLEYNATPLWIGFSDGYLVSLTRDKALWIDKNFTIHSYNIPLQNPPWFADTEKYLAVYDLNPVGISKLYLLGREGIIWSANISFSVNAIAIAGNTVYLGGNDLYAVKNGRIEKVISLPPCVSIKSLDAYKDFVALALENGTLILLKDSKELWRRQLTFNVTSIHECLYNGTIFKTPSAKYFNIKFFGNNLLVGIGNNMELYSLNGTLIWRFKLDGNITSLETSDSLALAVTPNKAYFISENGILGSYTTDVKHVAVSGLNAVVADSQGVHFFTFKPFITATSIDESIAREVFSNETPNLQIVLGKAAAKFVNASFTRDTMEFNGSIYKSTWKKEDYCLIQPENGRVSIVGTHRYGTRACLLYYKERKPRKLTLLRWRDLNRNSIVEIEELTVLS